MPKALLGFSGGKLPGRSTAEEEREEQEEVEEGRERQMKNKIAQEVVAGMKRKASALEDTEPTSRIVVRKVRQNCDSSQIEEDVMGWHEEDELRWKRVWNKRELTKVYGILWLYRRYWSW